MRLAITYQGSGQSILDLHQPFTHIAWSLGVYLLENGDACIVNGVGNADKAGGVYVNSIKVDGVELFEPGNHYLPPRCILPIRKSGVRRDVLHAEHLPKQRPEWDTKGNNIAAQTNTAIKAGLANPSLGFFFNRMGPWYPNFSGQPQPGAVSGQGLEFLPGWERNSTYRLLMADHTMHHMALAYVDATTGKPLTHTQQPDYTLWRGYAKTTQLAEFCIPASSSPYDDNRRPKDANTGSCAYYNTITGMDRYNGCLPDDIAHLIRGYRHALAGWQVYGDLLCKLYLDLIACDVALYWGHMPVVAQGQGAGWARRDAGWALHLLNAVGHPAARPLNSAFERIQMQNSLHMRCQWGIAWGFAPDPWNDGYALHADDVGQSIEEGIIGHALFNPFSTAEALTRHGNPSHWMLVAPGRCDLDLHQASERESFNIFAVTGRALQGADRTQRATLLERLTHMNLPDDPKHYATPEELLAAAVKNQNIGVLAPLIKALDYL